MSPQSGRKSRTTKVYRNWNELSYNGKPGFWPPVKKLIAVNGQVTDSEGHARLPNGGWAGGGPFSTVRCTLSDFPTSYSSKVDKTGEPVSYSGSCYCPIPDTLLTPFSGGFGSGGGASDSDLNAAGATAISICGPTNPAANAAVAIGEVLKDGLPALPGVHTWQRKASILKAAGSEYLNAVFGYLPLIDEVKEVGSSARFARDILSQHEQGMGKNTRREFVFPVESEFHEVVESAGTGAEIGEGTRYRSKTKLGVLTKSTKVDRKRWFSGCFTYAVPNQGDSWRNLMGYGSEADKLFGTTLTPDVLWELAPWSWAVDWFSNMGDVINNFTQFKLNGQVMRYGYIMETVETTITYSLDFCGLVGAEDKPGPRSVVKTTSKTRTPANPFGFGLTWDGLSPTQLLIAAAIGITR